jgi:tetratricopeptide (TPR) repeat protein
MQKQQLTFALACLLILICAANATAAHYTNSAADKKPNQNHSDSNDYLQKVKEQLEHFWSPARGSNAHATVTFRINKNGRVSWVELTDAASANEVNLSALNAVSCSSPFPPLNSSSFIDVAADFNSDFCPQYRLAYTQPPTTDLNTSTRLYSSAINDKKSGHLESALYKLQQAHQLTPCSISIRNELIDLYTQCSTSQPDQAKNMLHQALLLDPSNNSVRSQLNTVLKASGIDPTNYDARLTMARDYEQAFQYDDAVCEYGEAWLLKKDLSLIPEINLACKHKAKYADVEKWKAALKIANDPGYHNALAQAYEACDQTQNAISEYQATLVLDPSNSVAINNLGKLQSAAAAPKDSAFSTNIQIRDDFPYSSFGKCNILTAAVKNRQASIDYLKAACGDHITRWAINQTAFRLFVEDGKNVPGYHAEYRQMLIDAFATWVKASENRLSYRVVNKPQEANVVCYWVATIPPNLQNIGASELGVTHWAYLYHKSEANLWMPQYAQVYIGTLNPGTQEPLPSSVMKAVCLHELGHTLGITGHSPYEDDVMYSTLSPFDIPGGLTNHDVATIKRLYQGYSHPHKT